MINRQDESEKVKAMLSAILGIDELDEIEVREVKRTSRPDDLPPCITKIDELEQRITAIERILKLR